MPKKKKADRSGGKKTKKLLPKLKKDAAIFLSSEEGKITKENIVKTAAALGIIGAAFAGMVSLSFWNIYTLIYIKLKYGRSIGYLPFIG